MGVELYKQNLRAFVCLLEAPYKNGQAKLNPKADRNDTDGNQLLLTIPISISKTKIDAIIHLLITVFHFYLSLNHEMIRFSDGDTKADVLYFSTWGNGCMKDEDNHFRTTSGGCRLDQISCVALSGNLPSSDVTVCQPK